MNKKNKKTTKKCENCKNLVENKIEKCAMCKDKSNYR